ncbi:hypothetical protein HN592_05700 [Candidatus Woesearchaeota archaeon]|jgi:predicted methyltransferase|nr:hypothetical protein [Candidatus Woesearchaeota archaeon]MBT3304750.1 hypothetical protein [Candidatus Woesearchaeota archaeon]MBT4367914.1 hypothetical protein [Candidatus Woesearchaeota archaeon]MBT4712402.1 hypothetical protein [Candidatus Woesearchaeota archaeon]MBT6639314.1 hypothetical protein [Candidatus Woesearchaeota archaeon]
MLYDVLMNREGVNALKSLSSQKVVDLSELGASRGAILVLERNELVQVDEDSISISLKGKQVIKLLDELKALVDGKRKDRVALSFNLNEEEKGLLLLLAKNKFSLEMDKLVKLLKKEKRTRAFKVNKLVGALKQINLIKIEKDNVVMTELGKNTIKDDLLREFNLEG